MRDKVDMEDRRPLANQVFEQLYEDIVSLKLLPGTKLSEAEVARNFRVSPQPVRDAFHRLSSMDLLLVRPQRATRVRGFSMSSIEDARFIRLSVELEVVRRAFEVWDASRAATLQENLEKQEQCVKAVNPDGMQALDYEFHKLICQLGGCPRAFQAIQQQKQKMDRLCVLEYDFRVKELGSILSDHQTIAQALKSNSVDKALNAARKHLNGLDETIKHIHATHTEYFEDDEAK